MVLIEAMKRAGTTEGPKLREAIAATKDYDGITGKITLDPQRNASKAAVILTVKDGKFKFVELVKPE
jgi:branched-chain amino acid transport system substrate-binding protein